MQREVAISVIVPVYNMEKYLRRCMDSLVNQTFQDIEIIVIDDCSTDNSVSIVSEYEKKYEDKIIFCRMDHNSKQGTARNLGVRKATGYYIMFVDSDDWLELNACECLYKKALELNADIVYGMYQEVRECGTIKSQKACVFEEQLQQNEYGTLMLNTHYPVCKIIRRSLITDNNLYFPEGLFFEDVTTGPLYSCYASKIGLVKEVCYNYLQRESSVVHTISAERIEQEIRCGEMYYEECVNRKLLDEDAEIIYAKFFLSACFFPYLHSKKLQGEEGLCVKNRIEDIINKYKTNFIKSRYLGFTLEKFWIDELLPTYCDSDFVINEFNKMVAPDAKIALWGAGIKGKDFLTRHADNINVVCVIDRNTALHGTTLDSGHVVLPLEECKEKIDTIIITNNNYYYDIESELKQLGYNYKLINYEIVMRRLIHDIIRAE